MAHNKLKFNPYESKQNIKMVIAYDGTAYLGWQKTNTGPSIEGTLQSAIEKILQHPIALQAASRTDARVHAHGQVVNFFTSKKLIDLDKLMHSINCILPHDIVVRTISFASENFHPTLDCCAKEYRYQICFGKTQLPHDRFYSWHYPYQIDIEAMRAAARSLIGVYDFSSFCNLKKNSSYENYIREVNEIKIEELTDIKIQVTIKGNHFLYKMVRNIVGTLVYISTGRIPVEAINDILLGKDRTRAGVTAPAHGLTLLNVQYLN